MGVPCPRFTSLSAEGFWFELIRSLASKSDDKVRSVRLFVSNHHSWGNPVPTFGTKYRNRMTPKASSASENRSQLKPMRLLEAKYRSGRNPMPSAETENRCGFKQ
jgi:hypothetical protein